MEDVTNTTESKSQLEDEKLAQSVVALCAGYRAFRDAHLTFPDNMEPIVIPRNSSTLSETLDLMVLITQKDPSVCPLLANGGNSIEIYWKPQMKVSGK
jgi:hypothetical protein